MPKQVENVIVDVTDSYGFSGFQVRANLAGICLDLYIGSPCSILVIDYLDSKSRYANLTKNSTVKIGIRIIGCRRPSRFSYCR